MSLVADVKPVAEVVGLTIAEFVPRQVIRSIGPESLIAMQE